MTVEPGDLLCDRVLIDIGVEHGFGQRGAQVPENTVFPDQVHGVDVFDATSRTTRDRPKADVVISTKPGASVGIVTADCVPILVAAEDGSAVAAIHAGWRGLALGVIEAGVRAMMVASAQGVGLVAAVGPAGRGCCYEVDEPVREALSDRYSQDLQGVLVPGRTAHFQLDLPRLATRILARTGLDRRQIGIQHRICTICHPDRFESHRRDGVAAGRLAHFITKPGSTAGEG
jgi:YfiH family protein